MLTRDPGQKTAVLNRVLNLVSGTGMGAHSFGFQGSSVGLASFRECLPTSQHYPPMPSKYEHSCDQSRHSALYRTALSTQVAKHLLTGPELPSRQLA